MAFCSKTVRYYSVRFATPCNPMPELICSSTTFRTLKVSSPSTGGLAGEESHSQSITWDEEGRILVMQVRGLECHHNILLSQSHLKLWHPPDFALFLSSRSLSLS